MNTVPAGRIKVGVALSCALVSKRAGAIFSIGGVLKQRCQNGYQT